ncbi:MAG: SAM-dependent methyltransferase [Candidatus Binatia bacterium]|nr:SAM-dependent methyltransferase [Candidatus Binatia bacterium]
MPFTLDEVVPWGRSFAEYCEMFELGDAEFERSLLGCADGPASFNKTLTDRGGQVVSIDPIYEFGAEELHDQIEATFEKIMDQSHKNADQFHWKQIQSVEELGQVRLDAMHEFLADLAGGKKEGRYVVGCLPSLPFDTGDFDLALCAHFLFLYSDRLGLDFHIASLIEMARVATEVRVFPLLNLDGSRSRHVDATVRALREKDYDVDIRTVDYHFRKGGNELLTLRPPAAA